MPARRTVVLASLAATMIAGVYWLLSPRPVLVEVTPVVIGKLVLAVEGDGRTRVRDRYTVSAPLSGRVPRTTLGVGDTVKAGQALATISPNASPLVDARARKELEERVGASEAGVDEASALYERALAQLTQSRATFERTTQLKSRGVATQAQLDRDTFAFSAAERDASAAERRRHASVHALDEARAALQRSSADDGIEKFQVTSPVDAHILRVIQESEGAVALGTPLFEIGNIADLEVVVDLLTTDAISVPIGARAALDRFGRSEALEGRVTRIEPSGFTKVSTLGVEEQRVWVVIALTSPKEQWIGLGDAYRVSARIVVDEIDQATLAPSGALFRRGSDWQVFSVERGRARLRTVKIGKRSDKSVAIEDGLQAGQQVITYPPSTLVDGARVAAMNTLNGKSR